MARSHRAAQGHQKGRGRDTEQVAGKAEQAKREAGDAAWHSPQHCASRAGRAEISATGSNSLRTKRGNRGGGGSSREGCSWTRVRNRMDRKHGKAQTAGLGALTWCGYVGFREPCQNACTPLGPCVALGRERWDQPGTQFQEVAMGATEHHSPDSKTVPQPLGESRANWSKVRILPPALRMRLRARLLTRSAHTWGTHGTGTVRTPTPYSHPGTAGPSSPRLWPNRGI